MQNRIIEEKLRRQALGVKLTPRAGKPVLSNLRIEIEERLQAGLQLLFNFILTAFEQVHGHVSLATVLELEGCVSNFGDFLGGQQPQSIYKG